mgnify:CR=1 FL=1
MLYGELFIWIFVYYIKTVNPNAFKLWNCAFLRISFHVVFPEQILYYCPTTQVSKSFINDVARDFWVAHNDWKASKMSLLNIFLLVWIANWNQFEFSLIETLWNETFGAILKTLWHCKLLRGKWRMNGKRSFDACWRIEPMSLECAAAQFLKFSANLSFLR